MARFELAPPFTEKDLGALVLSIAESAGKSGGEPTEAEKADFESQILQLIAPQDKPRIKLVFDTADVTHIVIPYLARGGYSGNSLAEEAMGGIVIKGCGR